MCMEGRIPCCNLCFRITTWYKLITMVPKEWSRHLLDHLSEREIAQFCGRSFNFWGLRTRGGGRQHSIVEFTFKIFTVQRCPRKNWHHKAGIHTGIPGGGQNTMLCRLPNAGVKRLCLQSQSQLPKQSGRDGPLYSGIWEPAKLAFCPSPGMPVAAHRISKRPSFSVWIGSPTLFVTGGSALCSAFRDSFGGHTWQGRWKKFRTTHLELRGWSGYFIDQRYKRLHGGIQKRNSAFQHSRSRYIVSHIQHVSTSRSRQRRKSSSKFIHGMAQTLRTRREPPHSFIHWFIHFLSDIWVIASLLTASVVFPLSPPYFIVQLILVVLLCLHFIAIRCYYCWKLPWVFSLKDHKGGAESLQDVNPGSIEDFSAFGPGTPPIPPLLQL